MVFGITICILQCDLRILIERFEDFFTKSLETDRPIPKLSFERWINWNLRQIQ